MDECNWQIVPNTVKKRMVDSSFVHKLAPTKRLCRRTKVLNTAIRHLHRFKRYQEYVQMKTAILRNMSDDGDTDDNNDLSDNEYPVLCKSDMDITNSAIDIMTTSSHYSEFESDVSDYDISGKTNQNPNANESSASNSEEDVCKKEIRNSKPNGPTTKRSDKVVRKKKIRESKSTGPSASRSDKIVHKMEIRESKLNESSASNSEEDVCEKKIRKTKPNGPSARRSDKVVCKKEIRERKPNECSVSNSEEDVCKMEIPESKPNGPSASSSEEDICKKEIRESKSTGPFASRSDKIVHKMEIQESKLNESSASNSEEDVCEKKIRKTKPNGPSARRSDKVVCKKEIQERKPNECSVSNSEEDVCKMEIPESKPNGPSASSSEEDICKKEIRESKSTGPFASRSDKIVHKMEIQESKLNESSASRSDKVIHKKEIQESKPNESSVSSCEEDVCKMEIRESKPNKSSASSSEKVVCKEEIQESKPNTSSVCSSNKAVCKRKRITPILVNCSTKVSSNVKINGINTKQKTNKYCTSSLVRVSNSSNITVNEKLNKSNCSKTLERKSKLNGIRKNLISFLDEETVVQHVDKDCVNAEVCAREGCSRLKVEYVEVQEVSTDESKSSQSLLMQPPFHDNTNHPKDSGIDEDTEEEFHDIGRIVNAKKKKKMPEICKNAKFTLPVLNLKNASTIGTTLSNTDDLLSDIHNTSDTTDSQYTAPVTNKDMISETKEDNKLQKVKLQPKVTCTKVIKSKYRIISDNTLLIDKYSESSVNNDHISNKTMDPVNIKHNAEDSMSPLSKRRLQQMRRLNLTRDSDSSSSDDDNEHCNTNNMRDKLFNRSKEPCDLSNSEDENMGFKHSLSLENSKKLNAHGHTRFGTNRTKKDIHVRESYTGNDKSVQSSKTSRNNYKDTFSETDTYLLTDQYKTNTQNSFKQINETLYSSDESDSAKENTKNERLSQKNHQTKRISTTDETRISTMTNNSALRTRPHNLDELMDDDNLIYDTTMPSITLKELQESNIFLIDVPSMIVETELLGRKFILTENKLRLGKHKYKIALNDIDRTSFVLSAGESCTNYQAVTIKPMKKYVAYEKIVKTAK